MGNLPYKTIEELKKTIEESNRSSYSGVQKYILLENEAIQNDYEFIKCGCKEDCWCRRNGCEGHYIIKEIEFEQFLDTYTRLWAPPNARRNIKKAVLFNRPFEGRQKKSIPHLQRLMKNWVDILKRVRAHNKCGLCDNGIPLGIFIQDLYHAKMWSQLYYDSVVPFDTDSRKRIIHNGYTDPEKDFSIMNKELFADLKKLVLGNNMNIIDIRNLDKPWTIDQELNLIKNGQPLSRVLDKIFYTPK